MFLSATPDILLSVCGAPAQHDRGPLTLAQDDRQQTRELQPGGEADSQAAVVLRCARGSALHA